MYSNDTQRPVFLPMAFGHQLRSYTLVRVCSLHLTPYLKEGLVKNLKLDSNVNQNFNYPHLGHSIIT